EEDEDEPVDDEEELEEVVSAETQEWDGLESAEAEGEAEKTMVGRAGSAITSGFQRVEKAAGPKITSGFKAVRSHIGFPLWLRFDTDRNAIALLSLPRDLKVDIPGYGTDKINAAYSLGGPKLTLQTVKAVTGLDINHLVNVDFTGFARAVNAIGCVYIDVDH